MKKTFFTPGPSQIYPTVESHLAAALVDQIPSISHRSVEFMEIYAETVRNLKALLDIPEDYRIYFLASATECWERLVENCVVSSSFHFVNGSFSSRFHSISEKLGKNALKYDVPFGEGFPESIQIPEKAELVAAIANETSSGVMMPPKWLEQIQKSRPEKLVVLDTVSALPAYRLDINLVDAFYFSVQKGFGLPAGLGVLVLGPKAMEKAREMEEKGLTMGSYHRFSSLEEKALKNQTPETPNVLGIYLLGKVAGDMLSKKEMLAAESTAKAKRLYGFFSGFPGLKPFVKDEKHRSETVVVLDTEAGSAKWLKALEERGFVVGAGYGKYKNKQLRIANFPATSMEDVENLLAAFIEIASEE